MATAVEDNLDRYFGSLNSMTRKLWQEKRSLQQSLSGKWEDLKAKEKEEVFRKYLVDPKVQQKYSHIAKEETPDVFPKLKINSGEKIVVDFENDDGWTWRDEHSGPFSWMTRSQQDLTLDDLDNLGEQPNKKQAKSRGKSRSPERENNTPRKPRDSTYASHEKGTNAEAAHTADEIFQKFGIAFSFGKDEDKPDGDDSGFLKDVMSPIAESKLLPGEQNENFVLGEDDDCNTETGSTLYDSFRDTSITDSSDVGSFDNRGSYMSSSSVKSKDKSRKHVKQRNLSSQSEAEVALMSGTQRESDLDSSKGLSQGHVSPVFIEDPGESSTDPRQSGRFSFSETTIAPDSPSVLGSVTDVVIQQPTGTFNIADLSAVSAVSDSDDLGSWNLGIADGNTEEADTDPMTKSGFDFLDDW